MRTPAPFVALLAVASLFVATRPAAACFNEVERTTDARASALLDAEKVLTHEGAPELAARRVLARFPRVRATAIDPVERDPLVVRAARTLAVAIVRSGGKKSFGEAATWTPAANVAWATVTLREVTVWRQRHEAAHAFAARRAKSEAPDLEAELAEALALAPHTEGEAKRRLESLAKRDLLGSAPAWRTLARLRAGSGETLASGEALETCKKRASSAETCVLPLPPARD